MNGTSMVTHNVSITLTVMSGTFAKAFDPQTQPSFIDDDDEFDDDDIPMESREPSPPPPYPPTSPPDSDIWEGHLPVQPSFMSRRDRFATIEELLHLRYGFLDSSRVQPIDPAVRILETAKVLRILGYLKSPTTLNLTPNALHFILWFCAHTMVILYLFLRQPHQP